MRRTPDGIVCTVADFMPLTDDDETQEVVLIAPDAVDFEAIGFESVRNAVRHYQSHLKTT